MADDVVNIKVCSPLKLHSGLTRQEDWWAGRKLPSNLQLHIKFTVELRNNTKKSRITRVSR